MFKTYSSYGLVLLSSASSRQVARGARIRKMGLYHMNNIHPLDEFHKCRRP